MRAGQLRHRLAIQTSVETADTHGEPIPTWSTEATVFAAIEPLGGRELFSAQQIHAEISHRIRLRYRSGLTTKKRGLFGARVFDFQSIRNLEERGREVEILAIERGV